MHNEQCKHCYFRLQCRCEDDCWGYTPLDDTEIVEQEAMVDYREYRALWLQYINDED